MAGECQFQPVDRTLSRLDTTFLSFANLRLQPERSGANFVGCPLCTNMGETLEVG